MASGKAPYDESVKGAHRPRVEIKLTRTQILRQKLALKSKPISAISDTRIKMSDSDMSKHETKSKSETLLTLSDDVADGKQTDVVQAETSGFHKRKTTKSVSSIKDSLSPRIKRREIASASPAHSPRPSTKTVQKIHGHDDIHTPTSDSGMRQATKHRPLSSMSSLSHSTDSVGSGSGSKLPSVLSPTELFDRRFPIKLTPRGSQSPSKTICIPAQIVTDRLYTPINANEKKDFLRRKHWQLPSSSQRSRKSSGKKKVITIKATSNEDVSVPDSSHSEDVPDTSQTEDVPDSFSVEDIPDSFSVEDFDYDWLNRSARSDTDLTVTPQSSKEETKRKYGRRLSDPVGFKNETSFLEQENHIDEGFARNGIFFLKEYFSKDIDWLTKQINSFLSKINLSPVYPATTNGERYEIETRPTFTKPKTQEDSYDVSSASEETKIVLDSVNDVASVVPADAVFGKIVIVDTKDVEVTTDTLAEMVDAWTETWQHIIMCDVGTMTTRPKTSTKTTLTDPVTCDQQTSTDDIDSLRVKCEHGTSTGGMFDDLYERSSTPTGSSAVEDDVESSSAYGSYESGNLRKQLHDRGSTFSGKCEGFSQTDLELALNLEDAEASGQTEKKKSGLSEEETSRIQSELNRLARERIEIIELFALNVGAMEPTFTEELLEAKLNYSIGQTDQLLAMLEEAWSSDDAATSTPRDNEVSKITQEIIQQSRTEVEHSKRVIKLCIDEVKGINKGGSRHGNFNEELKRMKRKAEVEAFKLERMWEQLLYERLKKRKLIPQYTGQKHPDKQRGTAGRDPAYSTFEQHASYLTSLRNRRMQNTSLDDTNKESTSSASNTLDGSAVQNVSADSYLGMPGYLRPHQHKDYLTELRRMLISEHEHLPKTSRSTTTLPSSYGHRYTSSPRMMHLSSGATSSTRFGNVYPSTISSHSNRTSTSKYSSGSYRSNSQTSRSTLYSTPWSTLKDPVQTTSSYDKYKLYTGKYQTNIT